MWIKYYFLLLFIHCLLLLPLFVLGTCFVVSFFVSFLVLLSSPWRKESWLLYFYSLSDGMWLLSFFISFSWCPGLVSTARGHTHLLSVTNILKKWAATWDFQQCGMCDQQSLRSPCAYGQSDQSLCLSLEYSICVKLLTEHHLQFLSLTGGC